MSKSEYYGEPIVFETVADAMIIESASHTAADNELAAITAERVPEVAAAFKHVEEQIEWCCDTRNIKRLNRALGLREGMTRNAAAMARAKHWRADEREG
jgi:hypothetical protein